MTEVQLTSLQAYALIYADWLADGPVRLNTALTLDDLSGSLVLTHARLVMEPLEAEGGVKLTATGAFNRKFVTRMIEDFRWPGYGPEVMWSLNKVLNEADFTPLHYLHVLLDVAGLARKVKGTLRATKKGRSLRRPEAAGKLNAVLFEATFQRYNLRYLQRWGFENEDNFQPQIAVILYLIGAFPAVPRTAGDLYRATTLPAEPSENSPHYKPENAFQWQVLTYLEWFGLIERSTRAANDEWSAPHLFVKTPLFDRFLSFSI
jgi:hypothetical protein